MTKKEEYELKAKISYYLDQCKLLLWCDAPIQIVKKQKKGGKNESQGK